MEPGRLSDQRRRESRAGSPCGLLAVLVLLLAVPPAAADDDPSGDLLYRMHCQSCHGEGGRGGGPMAEVLKVAPPPLTRLTPAGGEFPAQRLYAVIDGRTEMRGHGGRAMPIWGWTFQDRNRVGAQEGEVEARIAALVEYLRSIQETP